MDEVRFFDTVNDRYMCNWCIDPETTNREDFTPIKQSEIREHAMTLNKDIGDLIKSLKQKQQIMLKISNGEERHDTNYALENMFDVNEILMFEPCTDYQKAKK